MAGIEIKIAANSTVRYLGIVFEDALEISEKIDV